MAKPGVSGQPLHEHLCYWLQFVASHANATLGALLAQRGMTVNEWLVLRLLLDTPGVQYHLVARTLGLGKAAAWKTVARLQAAGLLTRGLAPGAARVQELWLTPKGEALVPELTALIAVADRHDFGFRRIQRRLKNRPAKRL